MTDSPIARHTLLMSIHPEHAERIFSGQKTVELRRRRPRVLAGNAVVLYVSSPVRAVMGSFIVEKVVEGKPDDLWPQVRRRCGLSREAFDAYFRGATTAFGIFFRGASRWERPISL